MKVGIVGASGYSGEALLGLLLQHPKVHIAFATSRRYVGRTLASVFPRFAIFQKSRQIRFSQLEPESMARAAEIILLALPHGFSAKIVPMLLERGVRVIDLSADFRLKDPMVYQAFYEKHPEPKLLDQSVYGLAEIYPETIAKAKLVASPGCYPTSVLLPAIPLLSRRLIECKNILVHSLSSPSGAGRKVEMPFLYAECNESMRPYGIPMHRHLPEMEQELSKAAGQPIRVAFSPNLVPTNRGILTTLYLNPAAKMASASDVSKLHSQIQQAYKDDYEQSPFVNILGNESFPDTKHVAHTNLIEIAWRIDPRTERLIVMSAEDNLLKGAGGQAVQCLNLMAGFEETAGLI